MASDAGRGSEAARDRADFLNAVLEALPAAAFVIDGVGTVLFVTAAAASTVGRDADDLVGESVLSFVTPETAWAYAAAVAMATDYPELTMGPLRIELVRADGRRRSADLWATNKLDDPTIGGIVCLLSEETSAVGLAEGVASVAEGASLETASGFVIHAMRGHPVVAEAALLVPVEDEPGRLELLGPTSLPPTLVDAAVPTARTAIETGVRQFHRDLSGLCTMATQIAEAEQMAALWVEPVPSGNPPAEGALVLWRRRAGEPSPNQLSSIYQGAGILSLAMARDRYRACDRG